MFEQTNVQRTIDGLRANVAVLNHTGQILEVNEGWRRFGARRDAATDFVGFNYLRVCAEAVGRGDVSAARVVKGLGRLLKGDADSFGVVYRCGDRIFRMSARHVSHPVGGVVVAHHDITALLEARRERDRSIRKLDSVQRRHADRVDIAHEELGQRLAAISLAAGALESGGSVEDAVTLIKLAVEEARQELKLLRYETRQR